MFASTNQLTLFDYRPPVFPPKRSRAPQKPTSPKPQTNPSPVPPQKLQAQPQSTDVIEPSYWADLCTYLTPGAARPALALVGPAGNGKTTAAEAVCTALKYEYIVIDATEYLEPADLVGCMTYDPQKGEVWRDGPVTKAFREGKAVIINEFDSLNPRAALCLQSATQDAGPTKKSRYMTTPGGPEDRVYPTSDCPIIVTMNTYGTGATRQYVGRNALDAATADRFTILSTGYENEAQIISGRGYTAETASRLEKWAHEMRTKIEDNALRVILSMRTLLRLAQAIEVYGQAFETAIEKEFLGRLEADTRELLR
jgi:MoxR-like ATPase